MKRAKLSQTHKNPAGTPQIKIRTPNFGPTPTHRNATWNHRCYLEPSGARFFRDRLFMAGQRHQKNFAFIFRRHSRYL